MSAPLYPLPDLDPLTAREVAAALGMSTQYIAHHAARGRFPGAYRTPGAGGGPGNWRIPHAAAIKVGRQMGMWDE